MTVSLIFIDYYLLTFYYPKKKIHTNVKNLRLGLFKSRLKNPPFYPIIFILYTPFSLQKEIPESNLLCLLTITSNNL